MGTVTLLLGVIIILWGLFVLYFSIFKLKRGNYKEKSPVGESAFIEMEFVFRLISRLPWGLIKGFVVVVGISLVACGFIIL